MSHPPPTVIQRLCSWILVRSGWQFDYQLPEDRRFVLIGYPHTSNWDFVLGMLAMFSTDIRFHWVAKHSLFFWPLGPLMRAMGGIPVDRTRTKGFTGELARSFEKPEQIICITPEGTRSRTEFWRSGFYHLAKDAGVPVALGYLCFRTKRIGIGPLVELSGDIDADLEKIRDFYADKVGLYPDKAAPIRFRPKRDNNG